MNNVAYCMAEYLKDGEKEKYYASDDFIWYFLFILFVPYAMLPLPLRWCMIAGTVSAFGHVLVTLVVGIVQSKVRTFLYLHD